MSGGLKRIGRYEIKGRIGGGGMGTLYLALDTNPKTSRLVAIKLLRTSLDSEELRRRFELEAQALSQLNHANIVVVYDSGEHEDAPYIVMEFIRGETISELIERRAKLSLSRKLERLSELCLGLATAHEAGFIHRDIKPANLMVDRKGPLKILDFGITRSEDFRETLLGNRLTRGNTQIGTPGYMSPEQIEGRDIDARTDLFAVGAVAYEFLTYQLAFQGDTSRQVEASVLNDTPEPLRPMVPDADEELERVVMWALEKDPARRCPDSLTLARAFTQARVRLGHIETEIRSMPVRRSSGVHKTGHERRAELAYETALNARDEGSVEYAKRSALEALAELPRHEGARLLLRELGRYGDVEPWLPETSAQPPGTDPTMVRSTPATTPAPGPARTFPPIEPSPPVEPVRRHYSRWVVPVGLGLLGVLTLGVVMWILLGARDYALEIESVRGGTIRVNDQECGGAPCVQSFSAGQEVEIEAVPAADHQFQHFTGDCSGELPRYRLKMTASMKCGATFVAASPPPASVELADSFNFEVRAQPGGVVEGDGLNCRVEGGNCSKVVARGTPITLRARADQSYRFVGWAGGCAALNTAAGTSLRLTVTGNLDCHAVFAATTSPQSAGQQTGPPPVAGGGGAAGTGASGTSGGTGAVVSTPPGPADVVLNFERPENGTLRIPNQSFYCGTKGMNCQIQGPPNTPRTIRVEPDPGFMLERTTCGSSKDETIEVVLDKSRSCRVSFVKDLNAPPVEPSPRQHWTNPRDGRQMVWIAPPPKGQFLMGSPRTEQGRQSAEDGGPFPAALTSGFWMDVKEVTRAAFSRFDKAPRSGNPDLPMTMVTWEEAASYCRWSGGRLPTEPEWEFAARAEGRFAYPWGSDSTGVLARFANNSGNLEPVGRRNPNPFDLYDISGNAAEWTQSSYRAYPFESSTTTDKKVVRGGSFGDPPEKLRVASREAFAASERSERIGFRCARQ